MHPVIFPCEIWEMFKNTSFEEPGRFLGIAGKGGNHGNHGKYHKSHEIVNQIKRSINKLCLTKVSRQKVVRIEFSVNSAFSNMLYGKKQNPGNAGNQQKTF